MPRLSSLLFTLTLVATALVSCKPTPQPTGIPYDLEVYGDLENLSPRNQVVVYWYHQTGPQEEALLELIDEFNVRNEWGITVIGEYGGTSDTIYEEIAARAGSRALPGIVTAEPYQAAAYATQGVLVALSPYAEGRRWGYTAVGLRDFLSITSIASSEPRYGWPFYASMEVLYYNEDRLAELGYTGPPTTWDEFEEMACAASDLEGGTYGYEFSASVTTFIDMLANRGGQMLNADATAYAFAGSEGLATLTFVQGLFDEGCAILEEERFGARTDFSTGKVLFTIGSAADLPGYRNAVTAGAGFNWSVAPLPTTLDTPRIYVHGPSFLLLKTTPKQQLAAWLFLKWFTEPEQQAQWASALSYFPVRASTADLLQDYFAENLQYQRAFGFLGYDSVGEPDVTGYSVCRSAIHRMLTAVADGEDAAAWLAIAATECDNSLPH